MKKVDIIGFGMTEFGNHSDKSLMQLGAMAALEAIKDAGLEPPKIGIGFFANALGNRLQGEFTTGQNVLWQAGVNKIPVINVENACTSGSSALHLAWLSIISGLHEIAIVVGAEKLMVPGLGLLSSGDTQLDTLEGLVAPASFAMRAALYMKEYNAKPGELACVAVKNRYHGSLNPKAQFGEPITVEEVLNSPMIVDPLTRLSCCPSADGAAALILCASNLSHRYTSKPIHIRASILVTGNYENPMDMVTWETDYRACRLAYEQAELGPDDLDVAECHDAFTIAEVLHYEAMGLCEKGEGAHLAAFGETRLGGRIPVNTSGGLLSRGHPVGATGVAQVVEGVLQLRGNAGPRQVEKAQVFLAHCMGGDKDGDTKSCTVHVLSS